MLHASASGDPTIFAGGVFFSLPTAPIMSPVYPPPSLHSFAATGKLGDEYAYQQNIGRREPNGRFADAEHFAIGKHAPLIRRPLSSYANCTAASTDIKNLWNAMDQAHKDSWKAHAKRWSLPIRIAFGKYNMRRVVNHLPILDHPPD